MYVCVLLGAPQKEVRRSPEQVQIELNLIPHCAGTGMKLHNCTLIDNRTPSFHTLCHSTLPELFPMLRLFTSVVLSLSLGPFIQALVDMVAC